ncbi:2Fe-2S iron-sulfur cluster-binding protein [Paenibacillus flagellatus]|uniref:Ferredoxin n=1 Tax=Paenibacillus flagellatus TaxID=2211139 RepID=A0A2V5KA55_9BACL|nr:2Fe-2S iron-sulfur cluster-binding protein [Paenibacillus flagellatus]PYI54944.1 ferredoxin [Paenibacillus flagellatus]
MIELIGRTKRAAAQAETGWTILELALKADVDWGFSCTRGTCSRCRCLVSEGMELLNEPTDAELDGLDDEELAQGYRLGCQAKVIADGTIAVRNKPYF